MAIIMILFDKEYTTKTVLNNWTNYRTYSGYQFSKKDIYRLKLTQWASADPELEQVGETK